MTIPRNLSFLAEGASSTGVLGTANGGTGLNTLGTAGQALVVNSGATGLTYSTPSAGAMVLISTLTGNGSSTMQWTGLSGYNSYCIIFKNIQPQSGGTIFGMLVGTGSTTYLTSGYAQAGMLTYANNTYYGRNSTTSYFQLCGSYIGVYAGGTGANGSTIMGGFISNYFSHQTNSLTNSPSSLECDNISGAINSSNTVTAIKLQFSDGSVPSSGTASLYGISS
jgi:hypothetical protein